MAWLDQPDAVAMDHHRINADTFDSLAGCRPDPEGVQLLRRSQASRMMLLLCHIAGSRPELSRAVEVLSQAQMVDAQAALAVITYPWVGAWAAHCVRSKGFGGRDYFTNVAGAAAFRVGLVSEARCIMALGDSSAYLPSLGPLVELDAPRASLIRVQDDTQSQLLDVTIDDLDPWRYCHGRPMGSRLSPAERRAWNELVTEAWAILQRCSPARAAEVAGALTSIAPLSTSDGHIGESVSSADAFGGFAASLTTDAVGFAAVITHEVTHSKTNALHALVPLYEAGTPALYFAPWRPDPRPLGGLVHGLAAFCAVADIWRDFALAGVATERATAEIARYRLQVSCALDQITHAPGLTPAGRQFLAGIRRTADDLMSFQVPKEHDVAATRSMATIERAWYLANRS